MSGKKPYIVMLTGARPKEVPAARPVETPADRITEVNRFMWPSLHLRAVVKIAITVWTDHYLVPLGESNILKHDQMRSTWEDKKTEMFEEVQKLNLENNLIKEIKKMIELTGYRILAWVDFHEYHKVIVPVPNNFVWTPYGTIDLKRTAESFIDHNFQLEPDLCYKLACIYCLYDRIHSLWKLTSPDFKNLENIRVTEPLIVSFQCHSLANKLTDLVRHDLKLIFSLYQTVFEYAAESGNAPAIKCFVQEFKKYISADDVGKCVVGIAGRKPLRNNRGCKEEQCGDVLSLLIFTMTLNQRKKVLKKCSSHVLEWLTEWPWQGCFMPAAENMLEELSNKTFENTLCIIYVKHAENYIDYNYMNLFQSFWARSKPEHKTYIENIYEKYRNTHIKRVKRVLVAGEEIKICKSAFARYIPWMD